MDGNAGVEEDVAVGDVEVFEEVSEEVNSTGEVQKTRLDSFTMNFSGEINVDMLANSLRYILSGSKAAKIQIICELE